jgi:dipeptidyl aminopeptidase/acylaminoacyl peptidase
MNRRDPRLMDCYRIDVRTGELELAAENLGNVLHWLADHQGRVRAALALAEDSSRLLYRETEDHPFRTVTTATSLMDLLEPLSFTFDGRHLYVRSNRGRGTSGLYAFDPATGEFIELLFQHPEVDFGFIFLSHHRQLLRGVAYFDDRLSYHFFDPEGEGIQRELESRLPGYTVWVTSLSQDETRMLVRTLSDKSLGAYYLFNRPSGELMKLADASPWIDETQLCDMQQVRFTARDGLGIPGYLTLPRGMMPRDLPAVVIPCAVPWKRNLWGYDPRAQFLANRGYAVLQINYRGTFGYGHEYLRAGFGEWGSAVLDDLEDGVEWLIDEGIADPARVGILGQSVGGYFSLAAAAAKPGLFACAADYSGPTSLVSFVASPPPYWHTALPLLYDMIGHPEEDRQRLEVISPLYHPEAFDLPLLVAQGVNDIVTAVAETDSFVAALQALDKDVTYLRLENEGHMFVNTENRFALYRAFEEFFGEHLVNSATTSSILGFQ